jgi:hypothetical protein
MASIAAASHFRARAILIACRRRSGPTRRGVGVFFLVTVILPSGIGAVPSSGCLDGRT